MHDRSWRHDRTWHPTLESKRPRKYHLLKQFSHSWYFSQVSLLAPCRSFAPAFLCVQREAPAAQEASYF